MTPLLYGLNAIALITFALYDDGCNGGDESPGGRDPANAAILATLEREGQAVR